MQEEGYRKKHKMKKNMMEFYDKVAQRAAKKFGVDCTGNGWRQKYCWLNKNYEHCKRKIIKTGRDGDEKELEYPEFSAEIEELEKRAARNGHPAVLCSEMAMNMNGSDGGVVTSSMKRKRIEEKSRLEKLAERQSLRHEELIKELKRSNDAKEQLISLLSTFIQSESKKRQSS